MVMLGTHKLQQQATLTNKNQIPEIFFCFRFRNSTERKSKILGFLSLVSVSVRMVLKILRRMNFTITVVIHYLRRFPVNFPPENKVFQRPA